MFRIATINALALFGILTIIYANCFAQQLGTTEALRGDAKQLCTVAGNVLRAGTDEPLRKARVVLRSEDNSSAAPYVTNTDAGGRFTIEGICAGRYDFYVERNGYVPKFYGEDNSSTILTLKPAQQVKEVIFSLAALWCDRWPGL